MKKTILLVLFFSLQSFSQNTFTVYFETNSFKLNESEQQRLNQFLENKTYKITKVLGYCDYRSSNSYNYILSANRAKFVKDYIEDNSENKNIILVAKGEKFKKDKDLSLNRKVDIIYEEESLTSKITKLKKGDKLILKNLNFHNNSGDVLPESKPVLEEVFNIMKNFPNLKIDIQGHICCQTIEGAEKIEDIAKIRAMSVYNFLIYAGIKEDRLSYKSFKSTQPIFPIPEKTEEQRIANRRVEIMIVEN